MAINLKAGALQPADDDSSLLWTAVKWPLTAIGYGLQALDLPRRAIWTLAHKGSAELGAAIGTRQDYVPTWGEAWRDMETGKGVLNLYSPEWVQENERAAWWAGLGLEIAGDPLNMLSGPGAMTAKGRALKMGTPQGLAAAAQMGDQGAVAALEMVGKYATNTDEMMKLSTKFSRMLLGVDWAQQSKMGQRALVSMFGQPIVNAPGAVGAIGIGGRSIGKALGWAGEKVFRTDFFSRTLDPALRRVQEIAAEESAEAATKLIRITDDYAKTIGDGVAAVSDATGAKAADVYEQVARAAEAYGRPGHYVEDFAKFAPEIQDLAAKHHMYNEEYWKVATELTGIERPKMGAGLDAMLSKVRDARSEVMEEFKRRIGPELEAMGKGTAKTAKQFFDAKEEALNAFEAYRRRAAAGRPTREVERLYQKASSKADDLNRKLLDELEQARRFKAGEVVPDDIAKRLKALDEDITKLQNAQDALPNYVMRMLSPKAKKAVLEVSGQLRQNGSRVWDDKFQGMLERNIADRIVAGGKEIKRALSLDEFKDVLEKTLKEGTTSPKMKKYGETAMGTMDWIKWKVFGGAPPKIDIKEFYDMDMVKGFDRMNQQVLKAFESTELVRLLGSNADLVRQIPAGEAGEAAIKAAVDEGWIHIKDVSTFAHQKMGNVMVSPQVHRELRRTYSRAFAPESLNQMIRAMDFVTKKIFKPMVTVPESLPGGRYIAGALFGGTVGGLLGGDLASAAGGAALGVGASVATGLIPGFPAYHFRNMVSDTMLMSYNGKFNVSTVYRDGLKAAMKKGKIYAGKTLGHLDAAEINRMARAHGITFGEVAAMAQSRLGIFTEDMRRMGYFVDRLQHGFSPFQAAMETKRVLFDYGQLSDFERTVMRRVIPFWSWMRNITKVSAEQMLRSPAIIKHQLRATTPTGASQELPDWVRGRLPIAWDKDKQTGEERFLLGLGLPVENIADMLDTTGGFKSWVSQFAFSLNPQLKAAIGLPAIATETPAGGFWDDVIGRGRWPSSMGNLGEYVPKELHEEYGIRKRTDRKTGKGYYTIDPDKAWALKQVFNRFYTTLAKVTDERKDGEFRGQRLVNYLTGLDIVRVDRREENRRREEEAREREVRQALRRGDIGIKELIYRRRGSGLSESDVRKLRGR